MPSCLRAALAFVIVGCRFDASGLGGDEGGLGHGSTGAPGTTTTDTTNDTLGTTTQDPTTVTNTSVDASTGSPMDESDVSGVDTLQPPDLGGSTDTTAGSSESSTGGSTCPEAWWDDAWTRRRRVEVDGTGLIGASDAVMLLRLDPSRIDYAQAAVDGADLRIVQGNTELELEIEDWNPSEVSTVWVRVPALSAAGTSLMMYYGNATAVSVSDGAATWPDEYVSVHHLHDFTDATDAGHDAAGPTPPTPIGGLLAGAQSFDGNDDALIVADEAAYDFTTALTVEAWIRVAAFDAQWQAIVTKGDDAWRMQRGMNVPFVAFGSDSPSDNLVGDVAVDDGAFHHVAIVYGSGIKRVYVDGEQDVEGALAGPIATTNAAVAIGTNTEAGGREFSGVIDEVRISSVARDPGYFAWQFASMSDDVITYGLEQSCE